MEIYPYLIRCYCFQDTDFLRDDAFLFIESIFEVYPWSIRDIEPYIAVRRGESAATCI